VRRRSRPVLLVVLLALLALAACSNPLQSSSSADLSRTPALGACRNLTASDLNEQTNSSAVVSCADPHTAVTFASGTLPFGTGQAYSDARHNKFVFTTCQKAFADYIGADESLALRVRLSWSWFRPSERGWTDGARWYRCDLVGGPVGANHLDYLPRNARDLLGTGDPDTWLACSDGLTVAKGTKVPCTEPHTWRAVTTIKLGGPDDSYPGDEVVEARTRSYCQESVRSWLHYPSDYEYGFTWFKADRWAEGNRRSICWARTGK
jgi:hypothetical protein